MAAKSKAKTMGQILAERIVVERKRQGLTQQALVDRMKTLGHPMDRVTLSKIERGGTRARNVGLEEALALAAALSVPPTVLFLGLGTESRVSVLPKMVVHPHLAAKWVEGTTPPATTRRFAWKSGDWREAATPVFLYRSLSAAQEGLRRAEARTQQAEYAGSEKEIQQARAVELHSLEQLARVLREMKERDIQIPAMPEWTAKMKHLGMGV